MHFRPASSQSLRRQLLLWLLLPQLVLWAGGGALAYRMALAYAEKGIDQSLSQSVWALSRQVKPIGSGLLIDFPKAAQDVLEQDPTDRLSYTVSSPPGQFLLGNRNLPEPPGTPNVDHPLSRPIHYQVVVEGRPMRIASLDLAYGEADSPRRLRVQVGQSLTGQQRIAAELVYDMLAPLLVLGVLLSIAVYGGVVRGLSPLTRLTTQLAHRDVDALSPIEINQAPSEVSALVHAVNGLLAKVARNVSQEKRFLNDAAHQLRTPLAGLISQVELAQRETPGPLLTERLAKVRTGAERSAHLVQQLLALARSEAPLKAQPMDLAQLARDVAREWTPKALLAGMDLGYEGVDSLPLQADGLQLREALANLLDNVLRYTPRDTQVTLRAGVNPQVPEAVLTVEDNGPGLPPADRAQAFQRFWRGSQLPGGCGLGLSIVEEVAQRHGGHAVADSPPGGGLRVSLHIPLAKPATAMPATPRTDT
jgi:two-component system sensor histidine kinase TctE